jgi:hypothetical protein
MNTKQKEELAKYFLDISKLLFGGIVLIKLMDIHSFEKYLIIFGGVTATFLFLIVGIKLLKS